MRVPRLRVRTLMLAVGVVALLIWGAMMGLRSYVYYQRARVFRTQERPWREHAARDRAIPTRTRSVAAIHGPRIAEYYAPLARKYRRAAWRPWMPVAPDPPAPGYEEYVRQNRLRSRMPVAPSPAATNSQ
jgi:hypothetical protein